MAYGRRTTKPERTMQMRNTARRSNPFGAKPMNANEQPSCPAGQKPMKDPRTGKMTCTPAGPEQPMVAKPKRNY